MAGNALVPATCFTRHPAFLSMHYILNCAPQKAEDHYVRYNKVGGLKQIKVLTCVHQKHFSKCPIRRISTEKAARNKAADVSSVSYDLHFFLAVLLSLLT